jgi:predicted transcriptional regulator
MLAIVKGDPRMQRKPRKLGEEKVPTSVNFDPAVIDYLDRICTSEERSRSYVVNRIIKEHAERQGIALAAGSAENRSEAGQ